MHSKYIHATNKLKILFWICYFIYTTFLTIVLTVAFFHAGHPRDGIIVCHVDRVLPDYSNNVCREGSAGPMAAVRRPSAMGCNYFLPVHKVRRGDACSIRHISFRVPIKIAERIR